MDRQRGLSWKNSRKNLKSEKKFWFPGKHFSRRFWARQVQKTKKIFSWKIFPFVGLRLFSPSRKFSDIYQLPAFAIRPAWELRLVCYDIFNQRSPYYRVKKKTLPKLVTSKSSNRLKLLWNACSARRKVSENYLLPDPAERRAFDMSPVCYYNIHHNCQFYTGN
jgi:hypothetical protein